MPADADTTQGYVNRQAHNAVKFSGLRATDMTRWPANIVVCREALCTRGINLLISVRGQDDGKRPNISQVPA